MGLLCSHAHVGVSQATAVGGTWCRTLRVQISGRADSRRVESNAALVVELRPRPEGQQGRTSDQSLQPPHYYCSFCINSPCSND